MLLGDVVDQLENSNGLADAGAAKQANLAAPGKGANQIDNFNPGLEDFYFCRLIGECGCIAMNWRGVVGGNRPSFVDRIARYIHETAQRSGANRHGDRGSSV